MMRAEQIGRACVCLVLVGAALVAAPRMARAQSMQLSVSPSSITFTLPDPDTTPVVTTGAVVVTYSIRDGNINDRWTLTVQANGDFLQGSSTIPVSVVTWTGTPSPFVNGTMSAATAQLVAQGSSDVWPARTGALTFRMPNSWSYDAGVYTQTFVFTLTSQ